MTRTLLPSDTISTGPAPGGRASPRTRGGRTSHVAILARSFAIPAVLGLSQLSRARPDRATMLIVTAPGAVVIVDPDAATRAAVPGGRKALGGGTSWRSCRLSDLPAETRDGKLSRLEANIEVPDEVDVGARPRRRRGGAVPLGVPLPPARPLPHGGGAARRLPAGAARHGPPSGDHPDPGPRAATRSSPGCASPARPTPSWAGGPCASAWPGRTCSGPAARAAAGLGARQPAHSCSR